MVKKNDIQITGFAAVYIFFNFSFQFAGRLDVYLRACPWLYVLRI